jgi:hypothetical protein
VKCGLVRPQALYQFLDTIKGGLVGDARRQALIVFDLAVYLYALVTHRISAIAPLLIRRRNGEMVQFHLRWRRQARRRQPLIDLRGCLKLTGFPYKLIALFAVGQFTSLSLGGFCPLMPIIFRRSLANNFSVGYRCWRPCLAIPAGRGRSLEA